jgi:hypothetical protein
LEDEAVAVQGLEGWCRKDEVPKRSRWICSGVIAANFSPASQSSRGVEEIQDEDLRSVGLVNSEFLREKEMDMWCAAAGDPYPMEKNPDEVPMFARFVECGLALRASDFFKGLLKYYGIEYLNLNSMVFFTSLSSCTSMKHSWESSPTRSCSVSFSV